MSVKVFLDTNVWVYAKIEGRDITKHKRAVSLLKNLPDRVVVSTQVINEFYSALSKNKIKDSYIQEIIEQIIPEVEMMELTINTIRISWKIKLRYHFSIYDSLIVASALEAGCTTLYSEDLQHDQFIEGKVRVVNPFVI